MIKHFLLLYAISLILSGCSDYTPKKYAYPRIDYPIKTYIPFHTDCLFNFEIPSYSLIEKVDEDKEPCWYNIKIPSMDATIYLSYKEFSSLKELDTLTEETYRLAMKNNVKANAISETEIIDTTRHLYGIVYDMYGESATPFNFYLTDEKKHFIRGSFYFNNTANSDSVRPIYAFLKTDLHRIIETFNWD